MKSSLAKSFNETEEAVTSGQLTGIAADQNVSVEIDEESRLLMEGSVHPGASRQLRDIVRDSTERWLLADDYDDTSKRECHSLLLKIGCFRVLQPVPELIPNTSHLKVVTVSAGYAHCLLLTEGGELYAAGYNDRGQLGLGHRISTADFKFVDTLSDLFVLQVECGQQHTICRAVDRELARQQNIQVGDKVGGDAYVWGNGVLGQLGLGRLGTSKGRLTPTIIQDLAVTHPKNVICVSAGSNFTAAVTSCGRVYSWGHAEYNQHGTGGSATTDYTDPYHYFVPREVSIDVLDKENDPIVSVKCGSNFSLGLTRQGNVVSWGWGAYGVLGHGSGHFASRPTLLKALSRATSENIPLALSAGASHALAIADSRASCWAKRFRPLLTDPNSADTVLVSGDKRYLCHAVVLGSRSGYFRGYLSAAAAGRHCCRPSEAGEAAGDAVGSENSPSHNESLVEIPLDSPHASHAAVAGLLEYLYTDTFNVAYQTRSQLASLASELGLTQLMTLASGSNRSRPQPLASYESSFEKDLVSAVNCPTFADVVFHRSKVVDAADGEERLSLALLGEEESSDLPLRWSSSKSGDEWSSKHGLILSHQCVLALLPYFSTLFNGPFRESAKFKTASGRLHLNLDGFEEEGIDFDTFLVLVKYVYSGRVEATVASSGNLFMALLVAGNRFGLPQLAQYCERQLSLHMSDYPENIENLLSFARAFGVSRLEHQCHSLLASKSRERKDVS